MTTVRCLYDRARNLTQRDESLKEESHLMKTLIGNGYPRAFVQSASKQRTPSEPDDNKTVLRWPTFQALCRGSVKCAGTSTSERCLSPGPPSAAFLQGQRPPTNNQAIERRLRGTMHQVPCTCSKVYIGETKRRLETRLKEHKHACTR